VVHGAAIGVAIISRIACGTPGPYDLTKYTLTVCISHFDWS
jgi:hypothetical protein